MPHVSPLQFRQLGVVVFGLLTALSQGLTFLNQWQLGGTPQLVLAGMGLLASLTLAVFALWRPLPWRTLRPILVWFALGWFSLTAFHTAQSAEPISAGFYMAYLSLVAIAFLLLPLRPAFMTTLLSALTVILIAMTRRSVDLGMLFALLSVGLLITFLTLYGQTIRAEEVPSDTDTESPPKHVVLARISEFLATNSPPPGRTALLALDLELLPNITDVYGAEMASQLVERVSRCLRLELPGRDYLWHYGEGRFLLLLTDLDAPEAKALGEHLIRQAATMEVRQGDRVSVSGGLAFLNERRTLEDVLGLAAARLYRARRDRLHFVGDSLPRSPLIPH